MGSELLLRTGGTGAKQTTAVQDSNDNEHSLSNAVSRFHPQTKYLCSSSAITLIETVLFILEVVEFKKMPF